MCELHRLGLVEYQRAWDLQNAMAAEIARGERSPTLLLLEHPHTYTFGRKGRVENLLWDEADMARRGVAVHWVDRGGDVTYHGPGQLVGYPLLPLGTASLRVDPTAGSARLPTADYVGYVRRLEETLIATLASLGVQSEKIEGLTGVWVQGERLPAQEIRRGLAKIAAIGVKVDARGVTRHGFALNVDPDMSYWEGIVGCGLKDHAVASLAQLLDPVPSMDQVMDAVVDAFGNVFRYTMTDGKGVSFQEESPVHNRKNLWPN